MAKGVAEDSTPIVAAADSLPLQATAVENDPSDEAQKVGDTVLLEETLIAPGDSRIFETKQDPVLSMVSVNPRSARSFDVVRGSFTVLPELPSLTAVAAAARTLRINCGRAKDNTVVIGDDTRISLLHFTISVRASPGGCVALELTDQSSNGTWLNGVRLGRGRSSHLAVGDAVTVLPSSQVGRNNEVGFLLVRDVRGSWCSSCPACVAATAIDEPGDEAPVAGPSPRRSPREPADVPRTLERDLRCGICRDALHQCLTVVPCGHNFCSVCLTKWRRSSAACPECRGPIPQAVRNQTVDRLVETFLCAHPDTARSQEDLAAMEAAQRDPEHRYVLRWLMQPGGLRSVATPQRRQVQPAGRAAGAPGSPSPAASRPAVHHQESSSVCVIA